jgi:stress-induced-phosphoprotein 1
MTRHGNCLIKKGELEEAIKVLNRALTEHRNPDALKLRDGAEKALKLQQEESYVNLEKADESKNLGNDAFKKQDFPAAVQHYTEALKRGPPGKWDEAYKVYSNRAACFTKLTAVYEGAHCLC